MSRDMLVLTGDFELATWPELCVSCGSRAATTRSLPRASASALTLPYCSGCADDAERRRTIAVAKALAACLLVVSFALAFPLLWPWAGLGPHLGACLLCSLLPLVLAWGLWGGSGPRVAWLGEGRLLLADGPCVRRLLEAGSLTARRCRRLELPWTSFAWLAPVLALTLPWPIHRYHHPRLVVLNAGEIELSLEVDGRELATVAPSRFEGQRSLVELRVPSGFRWLTARREGSQRERARVRLSPRRDHLYAPFAAGHCFWLEAQGYGRKRGRRVVPLVLRDGFSRLEHEIDRWFLPLFDEPGGDRRSTGGSLVSLRQAPCDQAPAAARASSSGQAAEPVLGSSRPLRNRASSNTERGP